MKKQVRSKIGQGSEKDTFGAMAKREEKRKREKETQAAQLIYSARSIEVARPISGDLIESSAGCRIAVKCYTVLLNPNRLWDGGGGGGGGGASEPGNQA